MLLEGNKMGSSDATLAPLRTVSPRTSVNRPLADASTSRRCGGRPNPTEGAITNIHNRNHSCVCAK